MEGGRIRLHLGEGRRLPLRLCVCAVTDVPQARTGWGLAITRCGIASSGLPGFRLAGDGGRRRGRPPALRARCPPGAALRRARRRGLVRHGDVGSAVLRLHFHSPSFRGDVRAGESAVPVPALPVGVGRPSTARSAPVRCGRAGSEGPRRPKGTGRDGFLDFERRPAAPRRAPRAGPPTGAALARCASLAFGIRLTDCLARNYAMGDAAGDDVRRRASAEVASLVSAPITRTNPGRSRPGQPGSGP